MRKNELESLWNYGEPEAWRRGRNILLTIAGFYFVVQAFAFVVLVLGTTLELALGFAFLLVVWWLALSFIWLGTHWVRWLLGAATMLTGFALFIWGMRDGSPLQWSTGVVDLMIGAFCFAPSVHHFALRQKENIRWPEKFVVGAVFIVLLATVFLTIVGLNAYRSIVEREAMDYGDEALHRIFVQEDTAFLLQEATELWRKNPYGNLGVTRALTEKDLRLGSVENTRVTSVTLRSRYEFPAKLSYDGFVEGEGFAKCGQVLLRLEVHRAAHRWQVNGLWWQCLNTRNQIDPAR